MANNNDKKRKFKVGQVYLTDTFAGVRVKIKITRKEIDSFTKQDIWYGCLIEEEDAQALHKAGVPYSRINVDESIVFEWLIVKNIRQPRKATKNANTNRKRKIRKRPKPKSV